jgi:hypothetical protein
LESLEHAKKHSLGSAALRHRILARQSGSSPIRYSASDSRAIILAGENGSR